MPFVRFGGDAFAQAMGPIFIENLADLRMKVDDGSGEYPRGMLHTSTLPHPGTCYYDQMWSRDAGRALQELARYGLLDEARSVVDYILSCRTFGDHWGRTVNMPLGDLETDGNTHLLLGIYATWDACGRHPAEAKRYVEACTDILRWFVRVMDECPWGDLVGCASELSGDPERTIYAIFPSYGVWTCLKAFGEMAQAAGLDAAWLEKQADRLEQGMLQALVIGDGERAGCWLNGLNAADGSPADTGAFCGTRFDISRWTRQLPFIQDYDRGVTHATPALDAVHRASYALVRHGMAQGLYFRKYGFVSCTCWAGIGQRHDDSMAGYGQNYMTQAALLQDDVAGYGKCLEGIARLAFDGNVLEPGSFEMNPWVMHECFSYERYEQALDHTFATAENPGDEGNMVQAAETLKSIALVLGLRAGKEGGLWVTPRLPWTWDDAEARDLPVTLADGRRLRVNLRFTHERWLRRTTLRLNFDQAPGLLRLRFGPYPLVLDDERELAQRYRIERAGGASWLWLEADCPGTAFEHVVQR